MEKFYIVPEGTKLHNDFTAWRATDKELVKISNDLRVENGIETTEFVLDSTRLGIVPTPADLEKFRAQLCKTGAQGVAFFKKNSAVNKEWVAKTSHIKPKHKPFLPFYFSGTYGRMGSRLFQINGVVYCSVDCAADFSPLEPLQEIKASEFWRVIEDYEEAQEAQEAQDTKDTRDGSKTNYKELVGDIRGFLSNYKKIRYGEMVAAPWPYDHAGPLVYEEPEAVLLDKAANAITELLDLCKAAEAWAESAEKERDDALETLQNAIITGKAEIFKDYKDQLEDCMARALKIFARPGDPNGFCGLTQEFWVKVLGAAQDAGLCAVAPGFGEAYRQACARGKEA